MRVQTVVVGVLRAVVGPPTASPRRAAKVGGEPPDWIQIFADGEHTVEHQGKKETWLCDAESRAQILAAFAEKGIDLVIDYEHGTLDAEPAPASGWIKELEDRGKSGLWARVEWTTRAKDYIRAGEYRYYSPVYDVDPDTRRVTRLHHVAITNWPATHHINALTEQIAAKARAKYHQIKATTREGEMNQYADHVKWWLNLKTTATHNEVRAELQKVLDSIPADDQLIYAKAEGEEDRTFAEVVGYAPIGEPGQENAGSEFVAAKAVLDELELPEAATLPQVQARLGELKTPVDMVAASAHQAVVAERDQLKTRVAELEATSDEEKITQLIAANRTKIPPAREPWVRATAKKYGYDHAVEVVKNLKEELPASTAATSEPPPGTTASSAPIAATRRVRDKDLPVDPDSATRAAKVRAIQKENPKLSYREADEELRRREATSK